MRKRDIRTDICIKRFIADLTKNTRAERIGSSNSRLRNAKLGSIHLFSVRFKLNYSLRATMTDTLSYISLFIVSSFIQKS